MFILIIKIVVGLVGWDAKHIDNSEKMRIASNGNVGIGTTNPQASLHVEPTIVKQFNAFNGSGNTTMNVITKVEATLLH